MSGTEKFDVRVNPIPEPKSNVIAMASLNMETAFGNFAVTDICIVNGKNGPFVAMPNKKDVEGNYRDTAFPTTKEGRVQMNQAIMDAYSEALLEKGDRAAERPSATEKLNEAKKGSKSKAKGKADPGIE